jgi:hypothetical protein
MATKILLTIEGGVLTGAYCTDPEAEYLVLDWDEYQDPDAPLPDELDFIPVDGTFNPENPTVGWENVIEKLRRNREVWEE